MSKILIFVVIMLVSLSLGAIGVGIYIANFRSKPYNKNKNFSVATVSLIMITSMLTGLLVFGIYYGLTYKPAPLTCKDLPDALKSECCPKCPTPPTCYWGEKELKNWEEAQSTVVRLRKKADTIPRHMITAADCDATVGCVGGSCCGIKDGTLNPAPTPIDLTGDDTRVKYTYPVKKEQPRDYFVPVKKEQVDNRTYRAPAPIPPTEHRYQGQHQLKKTDAGFDIFG